MAKNVHETVLNLGCGHRKMDGAVNVDAVCDCHPDVLWDLTDVPWPWKNQSVDGILMHHVLEHIPDWWAAFKECARILKYGGWLEVRVPHHTSSDALAYRDHYHVFCRYSFHGIRESGRAANAWAGLPENQIPFTMESNIQIPHQRLVRWWFPKRLLLWCMEHLNNFGFEQQFTFRRLPDREGG